MGIFIRNVPSVMEYFGCSAEDAQRYIDLREEGYNANSAAIMAGLSDPPDHNPDQEQTMIYNEPSVTLAHGEVERKERRWFDDCPIALSIDCETLSLDPRAHILQVGYCIIDLVTGQIRSPASNVWIGPDAQKDRIIDPDTVRWWLSQNAEVRARVWSPPPMGYSSPQELFDELKAEISRFGESLRVWVRGNKDLIWLETLWEGKTPWHYRQATDMRPFVLILDPDGTLKPDEGDSKHDGAADAMHQAQYLARIVNRLRQTEEDAALYRKRVSP